MIASHTLALSSGFVRRVRAVMKSQRYQEIFGTTIEGKDTEVLFETGSGGYVEAVSFEAAPTGRGYDGLIIDDPLKADQADSRKAHDDCFDFFTNSLLSRLDKPSKGFVLLVMQRLALGDLSGRLQEMGDYEQLVFPLTAIEVERYEWENRFGEHVFERSPGELLSPNYWSDRDVEKSKKSLSDQAWAAQYQQNPIASGGNLIRREWLGRYNPKAERLQPGRYGVIIQSWDTASSTSENANWSVCLTWQYVDGLYLLRNIWRGRLSPAEIGDAAVQIAKPWFPRRVLIEDSAAGVNVQLALSRAKYAVEMIRPVESKRQRLEACIGEFRALKVQIPNEDSEAFDIWISEMLAFPYGQNDDQVDATTQFINWAIRVELEGTARKLLRPKVEPVTLCQSSQYISKAQLQRPKNRPGGLRRSGLPPRRRI